MQTHKDFLKKKINRLTGGAYKFHLKQCSIPKRLQIFKAYVRPHFDYACEIWALPAMGNKMTRLIDPIFFGSLKKFMGLPTCTSNWRVLYALQMWHPMTLVTWRLVKTAVHLMQQYDTFDDFCQAMPEIHEALTTTYTLFEQPVRADSSTTRMQISAMLDAVKSTLEELNQKLQVVHCIGGDKVTEDRILKQTTDDTTTKIYRNTMNMSLFTGHLGDATLLRLLTNMGFCTRQWGPNKQHCNMCKTCTDKLGTQEHFLLECPRLRLETAVAFKRIANLLYNGLNHKQLEKETLNDRRIMDLIKFIHNDALV